VSLSILNVGEGDTKLTFDKDKPGEVERTRRIISDMLKLGYAILVRVGETAAGKPKYRRATGFDPVRDEYLVMDVPDPVEEATEKPLKRGRGRPGRIPAARTRGVAVARSAGGMSDRAGSVEFENLERMDSLSGTRNALRELAAKADMWAGIPLPLEGTELVMEPKYALANVLNGKPKDTDEPPFKVRNRFYSHQKRGDIITFLDEETGRVKCGYIPAIHHAGVDIQTMGASDAWGVEQEANALQTLAGLLPHHAFKKYLLAGSFLESSERSKITYWFRKLKPTVALHEHQGEMKILCALCMHPIAYYAGTWSGAMCPTDDVIAHLSLMRGDEAMYWRRCNQHPAYRPEAGL
jgi:hypothetical protein